MFVNPATHKLYNNVLRIVFKGRIKLSKSHQDTFRSPSFTQAMAPLATGTYRIENVRHRNVVYFPDANRGSLLSSRPETSDNAERVCSYFVLEPLIAN